MRPKPNVGQAILPAHRLSADAAEPSSAVANPWRKPGDFLRFLRWLIPATILLTTTLWWTFAQQPPAPLDTIIPAGPVLYLEARDLGTLLTNWDASAEKRTWLASSNYASFSRSHLLLKLADAQTDFAAAAGIPADYATLSSIAGTQSALAIYDIGKLEFLFVTRLPAARALNTPLWRARGTYQTRRAGTVDYYVKTTGQKTAAFTYTGDLLLLATRESALAGALELIGRVNRPSLASEAWFTQVTTQATAAARDLRLVYNMERLADAPQFRSHWIQRNTPDLREFTSGLADLERAAGAVNERRVLLRANPAADQTASESPAGQLLAMVPDTAALYRLRARPTPEQAALWIAEKLFTESSTGATRRDTAPTVSDSPDAGDEADLETRIDDVGQVPDLPAQRLQPLRATLATTQLLALLEISNTRTADVFVRPQSAVVLLGQQPWDANAVRAAISSAANGLWTHSNLGAVWRALPNNAQELDGLGRIVLAIDGPRLILGDSPDLVNALLARRTQPAIPGAVYAAGWRHARELPNFERMMRLIDFPEVRSATDASTREPMFYSENLASLGRVLGRVDQATITVHDPGPMLRETVVYRLTP